MAPPSKSLPRGPCFHNVDETFETLLKSIAKLTPCAVKSLIVSKMQWKFETPLSGMRKLLTNNAGYSAMVTAAKGKKSDAVVFIYMPPPVRPEELCELSFLFMCHC